MPSTAAVDKPVLSDVDSALQEKERIITMSYALASEASLKSKQVAGKLTPAGFNTGLGKLTCRV